MPHSQRDDFADCAHPRLLTAVLLERHRGDKCQARHTTAFAEGRAIRRLEGRRVGAIYLNSAPVVVSVTVDQELKVDLFVVVENL